MSVPLDLARTLAVILDEGTLDAAARRLHLTPSAVTQRVRALDDRLGRVLLVRNKPVRATAHGRPIVRPASPLALLEHESLPLIGAHAAAPAVLPPAVHAHSPA